MEKQEIEKPKEKTKKRKRKVSIFTIFLWLFLIIVMSIILVGSLTHKNAIEVTDNNWNIQLVMYDRNSDTPDQAITDFTWNATSEKETRQLAMQINYACTTGKEYQPGEIVIEIPGIAKDSFSEYWRNETDWNYNYSNWLKNNVIIAADKKDSSEKQYDWSYQYDENNNVYTFTNNILIAQNEHFEGTIQIVYNLLPRFRIQTDLEFQAKIKENIQSDEIIAMESNICDFHYVTEKNTYTLITYVETAPKTDYTKIEDILDDYYWIGYRYEGYTGSSPIYAYDKTNKKMDRRLSVDNYQAIKVKLEEGCVLYDANLNKIEPQEGYAYYLNTYPKATSSSKYYYIGYPKDKYQEGNRVTNIAELWGRYEDEEEMQKLSEMTKIVELVDFDFEYTGDLYSIRKEKTNHLEVSYLNKIKSKEGEVSKWYIYPVAFHTGSQMDVEIGDDLLYITREDGMVTKLEDDEYHFTSVGIPTFYTYNKFSEKQGSALIGYEWELQVRYANTSEYIIYKTGITGEGKNFKIGYNTYKLNDYVEFENENIVGIKVVIKNLNKTLYNENHENTLLIDTNIHTQKCVAGGCIYNFGYIQVYHREEDGNRVLVNEQNLESYDTESTRLKVAEYDQATYGTYIQRDYVSKNIDEGYFKLSARKDIEDELYNDVKNRKYKIPYILSVGFHIESYEINKDVIINLYDILPQGITLDCNKKEMIESITVYDLESGTRNLKLKDGTTFKMKEDLENYIKEHAEVEIDYNYKDSGRTKISIQFNLNDVDWSYYLNHTLDGNYFRIKLLLNTEVSYDSILEYGISFRNLVYGMWNNQEYSYYDSGSNPPVRQDNGVEDGLASDIDEDGNIEELLAIGGYNLNITHAVSSQQAVIKQVRTDLTQGKYVKGTAEVSPNGEYDYKLRVTTGANSIKDLILYDSIEAITSESGTDISTGWKGSFLGVDTSYAERKGYAPKVYYSTELNPGKLTEVPDKWKLLDDSVDKSTVKSICIDLRFNAEGTEMELSPNNVVFVLVKMQAPDDENLMTSANNMFWTNWRAIDSLGSVIDNVEGIYSNQVNVEISKKGITTSISGQKTWIDEENKNNTRPANITVKLMQDGVEYETKTVTESDNWSYTFENVPVYRNNAGDQYEYTIEEVAVPNYITSYEGNNIINEVNLTEFEVEKIWDDHNNANQKRPESIVVELKQEGKTVQEATLNEDNSWKYTFTNLEKYNALGEEIVYSVDEKEFTNNALYVKEIVGGKITNKFVVPDERIKITGSKNWDDNNNLAGKRPESVILQVKNGEEVVTEQVVTEEDNWSYEFELVKYDEFGNEIVYTIDEKEVGSKFYEKTGVEGNVVTNKFVVPDEKIEIWLDKKWEDNNDEYGKRPESVILQIKNGETVVAEAEVSEADNWRHQFELTKYDELGNEINYTVDEKETAEYYEKSIEGYTIVNTCTYEAPIDTSDLSIWIYVVILVVAIFGICFIVMKKVSSFHKK